ncbi:heparinase II/III family protein, partial [Rhodosalinus sp.]|uniref:heparinase II/III domain-containing protein n=1 Tax=Rhodosalinus sp. TaxID=2047741 RepID=UPI0035663872
RRAGRAGASHSTLLVEGLSSARLAPAARAARPERAPLDRAPVRVPVETARTAEGLRVEAGQDGYRAEFGLTHARVLTLSADGRSLAGEDFLVALEAADERRFDAARSAGKLRGVGWQIRFHLHPDAEARLDAAGAGVSVALPSQEVWVFRPEPGPRTRLTLEPSVYLERGRLRPRATQQIVLSGRAVEYGTRVRWSLAKADDTALAVRDLAEAVDVYE